MCCKTSLNNVMKQCEDKNPDTVWHRQIYLAKPDGMLTRSPESLLKAISLPEPISPIPYDIAHQRRTGTVPGVTLLLLRLFALADVVTLAVWSARSSDFTLRLSLDRLTTSFLTTG